MANYDEAIVQAKVAAWRKQKRAELIESGMTEAEADARLQDVGELPEARRERLSKAYQWRKH